MLGLGFEPTTRRFPGALFVAAGGYHHHVGLNTWAAHAPVAGPQDAGLDSWTLVLASAEEVRTTAERLAASGVEVRDVPDGFEATDPWGVEVRIVAGADRRSQGAGPGSEPLDSPAMSAPRALESRSPVPVWAALCFLLSGAAGLIHEVAWSKWIGYLLGSSLQSVATVTAAFLAGLALGARLLGPRMARRGDPALAYARLEVAIGVLGALMIPLLRALDGPVGMLYRAAGGEGALFATLRVALLLVLLVPPAALMGATLPVLVARCERGALGAGLATLYALNTFGAVAGALAAGFVLLPGVGVWNA
ncbi:MAG: hypothetical protein ACKOC6_01370, partial [bacterium]